MLALAGLALLTTSCQPKDPLDELIADSPFQDFNRERTAKEVLLVTCQFNALELPGQIVAADLPFWREFGPSRVSSTLPAPLARTWRANGFLVTIAPTEQWPLLRRSIIAGAGTLARQGSKTFRSPVDLADFPAYGYQETTSLFVVGANPSPRGLTAPPGQCSFRVTCVPHSTLPDETDLHVRIVPNIIGSEEKLRFVKDQQGARRIRESANIVFDELALEILLPKEHFICIAAASQQTGPDSLGQLFMRRHRSGENYQQLIVLVPEMRMSRALPSPE